MPIAMVPKSAQTITMIAAKIMLFGNPFAGSSTLFTYGEIFSQPPTAKTRMDRLLKYFQLKAGIIFFKLKSTDR